MLTLSLGPVTSRVNFKLYNDVVPKTTENFAQLCNKEQGQGYKGSSFHRIIPNFMIQGGDPLGQGVGGPGYNFNDEISPELDFTQPYKLAMANAGPNTNGSQFFITVTTTPHLNGKHTIFGEVADEASKAVVDAIENVPTGPGDAPREPVVITSVDVERD